MGFWELQGGSESMRYRLLFAVSGAMLFLLLDWVSMVFMFTDKVLMYVFYAPLMLGTNLLIFARDELGWSIPSDRSGDLPYYWSKWLIDFNLLCYAALGFGIAWWIGKRFQPPVKTH